MDGGGAIRGGAEGPQGPEVEGFNKASQWESFALMGMMSICCHEICLQ